MEAGEENSGNINLKRQRAPLSDSEDNVLFPSEVNDGQKRQRLVAAGQENCDPKPSSSVRLVELEKKPDTPIVPSVRSRVQQITQRRDGDPTFTVAAGGAPVVQRCLSDPGADSPSIIQEKTIREHLLGEGEFNQRMERFKAPVFQESPAPSLNPSKHCPRTCSNFVSGIQQKLQTTTTPSSKQASRIREERKQELSMLQPISKNAWLKRSISDPSLIQQADGDAEMKDDSITEPPISCTEKQSTDRKGEMAIRDPEGPATSAELKNSNEGQLEMQWKENQCKDIREDNKHEAPVENEEEQLKSKQSQTQTVLKLSFGEDQVMSEWPKGDEQSLQGSSHPEEPNLKGTGEVSVVTEQVGCEVFSFEEIKEPDGYSYSEEEPEPSTDEEVRLWRYPQEQECKGEESTAAEEQKENVCAKKEEAGLESFRKENEREGRVADGGEPSNIHKGLSYLANDSAEIVGSYEMQEECERESEGCSGVSVKDQSALNREPSEGCHEETLAGSSDTDESDKAQCLTEAQVSDHSLETKEMEQDAGDERQAGGNGLTDETDKAEEGESSKKVSFLLHPELTSEPNMESRAESSMSDAELSSHDETNTAEIIDQMFEEVLEYAERMEEESEDDEDTEDRDSGIGTCSGDKDKLDTESMKEKSKEEEEAREEGCDESNKPDSNGDELLTFPPSGILSPLSKSVEAVVTPLRLAVNQESNPPSLLLTPEETCSPPAESAPLYSIDAYRTQRQRRQPTTQSVTPGVQRQAAEKSKPQASVNTKEKIMALNEEAAKLQTVISQTLQALSCCTDEEHGRGSLEEAEAEKLLLVSCEKRSALLAEVARLREEKNSESGETAVEDRDSVSQQPCRGTVSITDIQLPLKVEFVCSSHNRTGRPSHYFFVLIRYGPCNIVATPLATAADARNGDTISFPTSVTLKDIRASFEIDVEVYSLSHASGGNCSTMDRTTTKSWVTPKKLLNTITKSSMASAALPALNTRRSSNFCLVGSHKITLASLGHSKFPLDKMKLEGKIRRLLGDEFQQKVPFLSPLEGDIYLRLHSKSHSNVQHQDFLTMFEMISGYGVWHRRYFVLEGCNMRYWNHPNDKETKEAEGSISLSSFPSHSVRPVKRDSCARPFTFELVSSISQQQDDSQEALSKCWFSADNKQEQLDWMDKLNQALLDFNTWNRTWN